MTATPAPSSGGSPPRGDDRLDQVIQLVADGLLEASLVRDGDTKWAARLDCTRSRLEALVGAGDEPPEIAGGGGTRKEAFIEALDPDVVIPVSSSAEALHLFRQRQAAIIRAGSGSPEEVDEHPDRHAPILQAGCNVCVCGRVVDDPVHLSAAPVQGTPEGDAASRQHAECGQLGDCHLDQHATDAISCDACLVPLVRALNVGGLATVASCCGHGDRPGSIVLAGGTVLGIYDEARLRATDEHGHLGVPDYEWTEAQVQAVVDAIAATPKPTTEPFGTCDWGCDDDAPSDDWRFDPGTVRWLPVCASHRARPPAAGTTPPAANGDQVKRFEGNAPPPAVPPPGDAATDWKAQARTRTAERDRWAADAGRFIAERDAARAERDAAVERATRLEEGLRAAVKTAEQTSYPGMGIDIAADLTALLTSAAPTPTEGDSDDG